MKSCCVATRYQRGYSINYLPNLTLTQFSVEGELYCMLLLINYLDLLSFLEPNREHVNYSYNRVTFYT